MGGRSPGDLLFRRELEWLRRRGKLNVDVTVDAARPDWAGKVGVVPKLIDGAHFDPETVIALVCGPEIMMRFTAAGLHDIGLPQSAIFVSLERNMKCALGLCGRCQFSGIFACKDGAVVRYDRVRRLMGLKEI